MRFKYLVEEDYFRFIYMLFMAKKGVSKDPIYVLIGSNLKFLRSVFDLSQSDVNRVLDVSPQQYQKYENGINKISIDSLCKICSFYKNEKNFEVSVNNLIEKDLFKVMCGKIL